jgi:hypothetical protein
VLDEQDKINGARAIACVVLSSYLH